MQLHTMNIRNRQATAESHMTAPAADRGAVQAMVNAVRLRRSLLKNAKAITTSIAAPTPSEGFRDPRSFDDSAWRFRYRSAIAATAAAVA